KVDIAAAIANLDISQTVPLLGQREKTLREKCDLVRQDGELTRTRPEQRTFDANEISDIKQLVELEVALGQLIHFRVGLQLPFAIGQGHKSCLTKGPVRQDATRHANLLFGLFKLLAALC